MSQGPQNLVTTQTGNDLVVALRKRLQTQGFNPTDQQLRTLAIDVMNVINTDSANALSHCSTEITVNKMPPFAPGV